MNEPEDKSSFILELTMAWLISEDLFPLIQDIEEPLSGKISQSPK